ncbi:hypothetical protein MTR_1g031410 [Medicago truncatula]|uniref:Wall-associated receptor kinase galacturonan-binding domain-containing protein n=1 Tax=Medicago truncatula TaxID=3880 RepID=G7I966_MEDTR|nr:hypothetical protein MTR_1g031410 [Medicago truncatula]
MNTYYGLLLFMVYFVVRTTTAMVNDCPDLRSPMCGYPGFELFCSLNNETTIELPHSVKLNVKNIDYRHQLLDNSVKS